MPTTYTAIGPTVTAIVAALKATMIYPVFDGAPGTVETEPSDTQFAVIAGTLDPEDDATTMQQEWGALGRKRRNETMDIHCYAVGSASTISVARTNALAVIENVAAHLPADSDTVPFYNALLSSVDSTKGAVTTFARVYAEFTITAEASLTP